MATLKQPLAAWQEPTTHSPEINLAHNQLRLVVIGIIGCGTMIWLGIRLGNFNFWLATIAIITGMISMILQAKRPQRSRRIEVYPDSIKIDSRSLSLSSLKGYSIQYEHNLISIVLDPKKPTLVSPSFLFPSSGESEARAFFSQLLPELEPHPQSPLGDTINRYLHF